MLSDSNLLLQDLRGSLKDRTEQPLKEKQILKVLVTGTLEEKMDTLNVLRNKHLNEKRHRDIFGLIHELSLNKKDINPDALLHLIQSRAKAAEYDEMIQTWRELLDVPVTDTVGNILDILKTTYKSRVVLNEIFGTCNKLFVRNEEPVEKILTKIAAAIISTEDEKEGMGIDEAAHNVVQRALNPPKASPGLMTGLKDWDRQFGGLRKGKVISIAGYTGWGKTSVVIHFICSLLRRYRKNEVAIQFFSLEMPEEDIAVRIICWLAEVVEHQLVNQNQEAFDSGDTTPFTEEERDRILEAEAIIHDWKTNLEIVHKTLDAKEIQQKGHSFALRHQGQHVIHFLDHLGFVDKKGKENRLVFDDIMKVMKSFAVDHKATSIPLVQLKKEVANKAKRGKTYYRPDEDDIMESGAVQADSDIVILLWRPGFKLQTISYDGNSSLDVRNLIFAIVVKNRGGWAGNDILFRSLIMFNQLFDEDVDKRLQGVTALKALPNVVGMDANDKPEQNPFPPIPDEDLPF